MVVFPTHEIYKFEPCFQWVLESVAIWSNTVVPRRKNMGALTIA